jgi:hypothetical protein
VLAAACVSSVPTALDHLLTTTAWLRCIKGVIRVLESQDVEVYVPGRDEEAWETEQRSSTPHLATAQRTTVLGRTYFANIMDRLGVKILNQALSIS